MNSRPDPAPDPALLRELFPASLRRAVAATEVEIDGREAVRVELLEDIARNGVPDVDYVDMPTFLELPLDFLDGTIEVDILARLNGFWPEGARGFAGLAFRIRPGGPFESVYLRPTNGKGPTRRAPVTSAPSSTSPTPTGASSGSAPTFPELMRPALPSISTSGSASGWRSQALRFAPSSTAGSASPCRRPSSHRHRAGSACSSTSAPSPTSPTCSSCVSDAPHPKEDARDFDTPGPTNE